MDQLNQAEQAESQPNFVDNYFKQNPSGSSPQNFNQWQPVEDFLYKTGMQQDEEHALNGGSSHGSQTAIGSPHRGNFASGARVLSGAVVFCFVLNVHFVVPLAGCCG